jgi:hypothetical protein
VPPSGAGSWSLIRDVLGSGAVGLLLPASLGLSVVVFPPGSSGETRQKVPLLDRRSPTPYAPDRLVGLLGEILADASARGDVDPDNP